MPATTPDQDSGFGSSSDDDLDVWGATRLVPPLSGNGAATSGTSGHGGGFLGRIAAGLGRGTTGTVPLPRWCAPGGEPGAECTPADGNGGFKLGSTLRFLWRVYDTGTHGVLDRLLLQQCSDNAGAMCAAASSPARSAVAMAAALLLTSVRHTISVAKLPRVITCLVRLADHVSLAYVSGDQVCRSCHICAGVCVCFACVRGFHVCAATGHASQVYSCVCCPPRLGDCTAAAGCCASHCMASVDNTLSACADANCVAFRGCDVAACQRGTTPTAAGTGIPALPMLPAHGRRPLCRAMERPRMLFGHACVRSGVCVACVVAW